MTDHKESNIPGLIEKIEFDSLLNVAKMVRSNSDVVEFGCYLGRSTSAILLGLEAKDGVSMHVYDGFEIPEKDPFAKTLVSHAFSVKLQDLIYRDNVGKLHWEKVFDSLISPFKKGTFKRVKTQISEAQPEDIRNISLLHLDAPKDYEQLRPIMFRFFSLLDQKSTIVFQDFFYHWSSTLIAAVGVLHRLGHIELRKSYATSLEVEVKKKLSLAEIIEIDLCIESSDVIKEIEALIKKLAGSKEKFDRFDQFLPRLKLAILAEAVSIGDGQCASECFVDMVKSQDFKGQVVFDLVEMFSRNFSIK